VALASLPGSWSGAIVGEALRGGKNAGQLPVTIQRNVARHRHLRWLAIDDYGTGWADEHRSNLVLTDSLLGLGVASAQEDLREKLELLHR
jgi:hypothetical protein